MPAFISDNGKIRLKAWLDEEGKLHITDQDGREFDASPDSYRAYGEGENQVIVMEVEMELPHWPHMRPRANIRFSIPLAIKTAKGERLFRRLFDA